VPALLRNVRTLPHVPGKFSTFQVVAVLAKKREEKKFVEVIGRLRQTPALLWWHRGLALVK
jgi:hypothetical protein